MSTTCNEQINYQITIVTTKFRYIAGLVKSRIEMGGILKPR